MSCFRPNQGGRLSNGDVVFLGTVRSFQTKSISFPSSQLFPMPCGKCIGCKISYSKSWAVRNMHEFQYHDSLGMPSLFVTLTYNDEFNDRNGGALNYRDVQLFLKRLRKGMSECYSDYAFTSTRSMPIRFFMAGEYGSKSYRPHYHFLFYNLGFYDEYLYKVSSSGHKMYNSDSLSSFWTDPKTKQVMGHVVMGSITLGSAGYVSRYCTKKWYDGYDLPIFNHDTGEFLPREFTHMSRKPGIAFEWYQRYGKSIYLEDRVVLGNGLFYKPPRYYDNQLEKADISLFESVKQSRIDFATSDKARADNTLERLEVKERLLLSKLKLLPRIIS